MLCPYSFSKTRNCYKHGLCTRCFNRLLLNSEYSAMKHHAYSGFLTLKCPSCRNNMKIDIDSIPYESDEEDENNNDEEHNNTNNISSNNNNNNGLTANSQQHTNTTTSSQQQQQQLSNLQKCERLFKYIRQRLRRGYRHLARSMHQYSSYKLLILCAVLLGVNILPNFLVGYFGRYPRSLFDEIIRSNVTAHWFGPLTATCWSLSFTFGSSIARFIVRLVKFVYSLVLRLHHRHNASSTPHQIENMVNGSESVQRLSSILKVLLGNAHGLFGSVVLPTLVVNRVCVNPREESIWRQFSVDVVCSSTTLLSDIALGYFFREFYFSENEKYAMTLYSSAICTFSRVFLPILGCFVLRDRMFKGQKPKDKAKWMQEIRLI